MARLLVFRDIYWQCQKSAHTTCLVCPPGRTITRDGHAFAELLSNNSEAAKAVLRLDVHWSTCGLCTPEQSEPPDPDGWIQRDDSEPPSCGLLTTSLFESMINLKSLQLVSDDAALLKVLPTLLRLRFLSLVGHSSPWYHEGGGVNYSDLKMQLAQPKLEQVHIERIKVPPTALEESNVANNENCSKTIRRLTFVNVEINGSTLTSLFGGLTMIETLTLQPRQPDFSDPLKDLSMSDIYDSLLCVSKTLQNLSIIYQPGSGWIPDETLLGSLTPFGSLMKLIIDPTMLIGRLTCPRLPDLRILQPSLSFATKLPSGLEELSLVINLHQAKSIQDYRVDLLKGLLLDRKRLKALVKVTFLETIGLQPQISGTECGCDRGTGNECFPEDVYGAHYPRMRAREALSFWKSVKACREEGIVVELVESEDIAGGGWRSSIVRL